MGAWTISLYLLSRECLVMCRSHSKIMTSFMARAATALLTMALKLPKHPISFMLGPCWRKATKGSIVLVAWFALEAISSPLTKASAMDSS